MQQVLTPSDMAWIELSVGDMNMGIGDRFKVRVIPESGTDCTVGVTIPPTFGATVKSVELYP